MGEKHPGVLTTSSIKRGTLSFHHQVFAGSPSSPVTVASDLKTSDVYPGPVMKVIRYLIYLLLDVDDTSKICAQTSWFNMFVVFVGLSLVFLDVLFAQQGLVLPPGCLSSPTLRLRQADPVKQRRPNAVNRGVGSAPCHWQLSDDAMDFIEIIECVECIGSKLMLPLDAQKICDFGKMAEWPYG